MKSMSKATVKLLSAVCILIIFLFASCSKEDKTNNEISLNNGNNNCGCDDKYGSFTDVRDGHVYKTIQIDTQTWMAENLAYLPSSTDCATISFSTSCFYVYDYVGTNNSEAMATVNYATYGVLYNWLAAKSACPAGWHLPSDAEWTTLSGYLGGEAVAGGKMKSVTGWESPNTDASNESCFSALPGGNFYKGCGSLIGNYGYWWSSTTNRMFYAWSRCLGFDVTRLRRDSYVQYFGFSVRCIMD
jgi:uncharacterized protein (TIGR02145 family)